MSSYSLNVKYNPEIHCEEIIHSLESVLMNTFLSFLPP